MDLVVTVDECTQIWNAAGAVSAALDYIPGAKSLEESVYYAVCVVRSREQSKRRHSEETKFRTPSLPCRDEAAVAWNHSSTMYMDTLHDALEFRVYRDNAFADDELVGKAFLDSALFYPKGLDTTLKLQGVEHQLPELSVKVEVSGFWASVKGELYRTIIGVNPYRPQGWFGHD
eukprot:TRINITY_DN104468_c0_g1_i1.p1 TRINITY_DN104468_c0_g1~~TRINITY_DN104468_c0_g1_i1.p1  ORF type:complete len:174 (+),score=41.18 TRINITY_DN104468_c0_g1_i1:90-611(+)